MNFYHSYRKWVSTGIRTVVKANIIECITSHLTTFAVLVTITSSQTSPVSKLVNIKQWEFKAFSIQITPVNTNSG